MGVSTWRGVSPPRIAMPGVTTVGGVSNAASRPLDRYKAIYSAYGMRLLLSSYSGPLIRLREDSGDAEADFGAHGNGGLDVSAINTFLGSATGRVVTWYDQSGNDRRLVQDTAARQPTYVASGQNGHPTMDFPGGTDVHLGRTITNDGIYSLANYSAFFVVKSEIESSSQFKYFYSEKSVTDNDPLFGISTNVDDDYTFFITDNINANFFSGTVANNVAEGSFHVFSVVDNSGTGEARIDGGSALAISYTRGTLTVTRVAIGARVESASIEREWDGEYAEFVTFSTNLDAAVARRIEAEQKTYWGTP